MCYKTYSSGHQNWRPATLEAVQSSLTVALATVTMDTGGGIALGVEEVIESIATLLGLNEDECEGVS